MRCLFLALALSACVPDVRSVPFPTNCDGGSCFHIGCTESSSGQTYTTLSAACGGFLLQVVPYSKLNCDCASEDDTFGPQRCTVTATLTEDG